MVGDASSESVTRLQRYATSSGRARRPSPRLRSARAPCESAPGRSRGSPCCRHRFPAEVRRYHGGSPDFAGRGERREAGHARGFERRAPAQLGKRDIGTTIGNEHDVLHRALRLPTTVRGPLADAYPGSRASRRDRHRHVRGPRRVQRLESQSHRASQPHDCSRQLHDEAKPHDADDREAPQEGGSEEEDCVDQDERDRRALDVSARDRPTHVPAHAGYAGAVDATAPGTNLGAVKLALFPMASGLSSPVALAWRHGDSRHVRRRTDRARARRVGRTRRRRPRSRFRCRAATSKGSSASRSHPTAPRCTSTTPTRTVTPESSNTR